MRYGRARWVLAGCLLIAVSVAGLLAAVGVLGKPDSRRSVVPLEVVRLWKSHPTPSFAVAAMIAFLLVVLGIVLARSPFRRAGPARLEDYSLPARKLRGRVAGTIRVRAPALSHAMEADLERCPGVARAMVGLHGAAPEVGLRALIDITDRADPAAVIAEADRAVERLARTGSLRLSRVWLGLRPVPGQHRELE